MKFMLQRVQCIPELFPVCLKNCAGYKEKFPALYMRWLRSARKNYSNLILSQYNLLDANESQVGMYSLRL